MTLMSKALARRPVFASLALAAALLLGGRAGHTEPLPALGADETRTSVSGLSSGAYMAGQFEVAYSGLVIGAGIVAGGPFGCANTPGMSYVPFWWVLGMNLNRALSRCMDDGGVLSDVPAAEGLAEQAKALAERGLIDDLAGLKADRIYMFSSSRDETVESQVVERAEELYEVLGVPKANIAFVRNDKAAHAFITETEGQACGTAGDPFINDCDYDQAKAILETIYGALRGPGDAANGRYLTFDQQPFSSGSSGSGLADEGVAYIPRACRDQPGCAVHVVFHGCKQGREKLDDAFIKASGFARWAAANRIVLLFPQVVASSGNPNGCWDWWGYTGRRFLERDAPQMLGVRRMIARLAERG
jgi:hypothetical protein